MDTIIILLIAVIITAINAFVCYKVYLHKDSIKKQERKKLMLGLLGESFLLNDETFTAINYDLYTSNIVCIDGSNHSEEFDYHTVQNLIKKMKETHGEISKDDLPKGFEGIERAVAMPDNSFHSDNQHPDAEDKAFIKACEVGTH